jgi:Zn-finger nucleic acid-binding protein
MLHCSNCGGRLSSAKAACEYCSAEVKLGDRGLGPACPECFATTFAGAKHCGACGVRLDPQSILRALSDRACPRCKQSLSECEGKEARYVECTGCGGLWLDEELFERIAREKDGALAAAIRGTPPATAPRAGPPDTREKAVRYLPCPVCGQIMNRRNFASSSGVILDWCRGHGWWFDAQELERAVRFLEQGGLERARAAEHERRLQDLRRERDRSTRLPAPLPFPERAPRGSLVEGLVELLLSFW